jgi:hypothetical protein
VPQADEGALEAKLSRAARASHFSFGKSNQNHLRRTLADAMKPHRFPALLAVGELYGAKSKGTPTEQKAMTLRDESIAQEFVTLIDDFVARNFRSRTGP